MVGRDTDFQRGSKVASLRHVTLLSQFPLKQHIVSAIPFFKILLSICLEEFFFSVQLLAKPEYMYMNISGNGMIPPFIVLYIFLYISGFAKILEEKKVSQVLHVECMIDIALKIDYSVLNTSTDCLGVKTLSQH